MKKAAVAVAVFVFAALMVLPVVRSVNLSAGKPITIDRMMNADGWPQPPFPPQSSSVDASTLVADGSPIPPFPPQPPSVDANTLVADGSPIPPFPPQPPSVDANTLVADGSPIPPFLPGPPQARFTA